MRKVKKFFGIFVSVAMLVAGVAGCGEKKESILIYSSAEDYKIEYLNQRLTEEFPEYDIVIEYMSTGNHAAKLFAEGTTTDCDIIHDLEYAYLAKLDKEGLLADLSDYDRSVYTEDVVEQGNYLVECRNGGAIILNTEILAQNNIPEPTCYEDLLKPEYEGLVSMPNPKSSGTGYMFLKSLVNSWGEEEAFSYFDKLTPNVLQYTSSGSGPVNTLVQGEAAIGLGMTAQAVIQIKENVPLKIVYFEEGSPFCLYGQTMIEGKDDREAVKRVFDFIINTYTYENTEKINPEKIYKEKDYVLEGFPQNIAYSDMGGNSIEEKERLLAKWKY